MKKITLIFICLIFFINLVNAQKKNQFNKKADEIKEPYWFMGGALWMGFGSYTFVDVNIILGNQITERISVGVSGKYQYYNDKRSLNGTFETSVYGGSVFSQFAIIKDFRNIIKVKAHSGIIAHAEYEFLNTKYNAVYFNDLNSNRDRYWLNTLLIGGGYFQQFSKKAKTFIILLWNVNKTDDNPYTYPQLRIGFTYAL